MAFEQLLAGLGDILWADASGSLDTLGGAGLKGGQFVPAPETGLDTLPILLRRSEVLAPRQPNLREQILVELHLPVRDGKGPLALLDDARQGVSLRGTRLLWRRLWGGHRHHLGLDALLEIDLEPCLEPPVQHRLDGRVLKRHLDAGEIVPRGDLPCGVLLMGLDQQHVFKCDFEEQHIQDPDHLVLLVHLKPALARLNLSEEVRQAAVSALLEARQVDAVLRQHVVQLALVSDHDTALQLHAAVLLREVFQLQTHGGDLLHEHASLFLCICELLLQAHQRGPDVQVIALRVQKLPEEVVIVEKGLDGVDLDAELIQGLARGHGLAVDVPAVHDPRVVVVDVVVVEDLLRGRLPTDEGHQLAACCRLAAELPPGPVVLDG
mmetsp:Transcript_75462/g.190812  ORF Transcript_75462/g.190812 Transcript_75462/m.190812 type:complete len:380 (-) Transcript_75462:792-1931(-)